MQIFEYGSTEIEYLKLKDHKLGAAIEKIGLLEREIHPDLFSALISNIVSQQISKKAAATIWERLCALTGEITPQSVCKAKLAAISKCGMSDRKAGYIVGAAEAVMAEKIDLEALHAMSDQEVIRVLSSLHGVGVWTAEMILIFSMCRPDIVSYRDLAICRGMIKLYGLKELSKEQFERYRKRYSPYGSVASLYLWELSVL